MKLFKFPKRDKRLLDSETPMQRAARLLLIALLFAAVIWGFWMSAERRQAIIVKPPAQSSGYSGQLTTACR